MLCRSLIRWMTWLFPVALLWGCATLRPPPPPPPAAPAATTGALLAARLLTQQEPAEGVILQVTAAGQTEPMGTVTGLLYSRNGGRSADYLFPIPLPPGRYTLTPDGTFPPFQMEVDVPMGAPVYVGRLLLPQDRSRAPALEDHPSEDVPMFRSLVAQLRTVDIGVRLGQLQPPEDVIPIPTPTPVMEVVRVSEALASELPVQARSGFLRYLKLRGPRAFAVSDQGVFAQASGRNVVERAVQACNQQDPLRACRLFSMDQTAMVWRTSQGTSASPYTNGIPTLPATRSMPVSPSAPVSTPRTPPVSVGPPMPPQAAPVPMAKADPCEPEFKGWLRLADVAPQEAAARRAAKGCAPLPAAMP